MTSPVLRSRYPREPFPRSGNHRRPCRTALLEEYLLNIVEIIQDELRGIPHGLEQDRDRHFPAPVDPDIQKILGIEFQIQPGTPDGNDPGRVDQFSAGQGFPLVVIKKYTRRTVKLADDDPFRTVDDNVPFSVIKGISPK